MDHDLTESEFVLVGHRFEVRYRSLVRKDNAAYLLGKDNKPTRDFGEAVTLMLQYVSDDPCLSDNYASIVLGGLQYTLMGKRLAERYLAQHPAPRKSIGRKLRERIYGKFGGRCAYCGREIALKDMQVDHIVSHTYHKGEDAEENYNPSCPVCNRVKSANTIEEFRASIRNCARIHHGRKPNSHIYADSDKIAEYYGLLGEDWKDKAIKFYFEKGNQKP